MSNSIGWFGKLKNALLKTNDNFGKKILNIFGKGKIDDQIYEQLEEILICADIGVHTSRNILKKLQDTVKLKQLTDKQHLLSELKAILYHTLKPLEAKLNFNNKPMIIMMVGVNGAGKTTSIGKLTQYLQNNNKTVLLAAGDTFRAAAGEQLIAWGQRNNVAVLATANQSPAALAFDAIKKAQQENFDVLIIDTAGRLPTQNHLMAELEKINKVIIKANQQPADEILLILDATIGQNAINQVEGFKKSLPLTGLIMTKLDSSSKGGIVCALADYNIPIKFVGTGEKIDDWQEFDSLNYINSMLPDN